MDIAAIPAGRELDALIAEKVMGITLSSSCACCHGAYCQRHDDPRVHAYSTDIGSAMKVAERIGLFRNCRHLHENGVGMQDGETWRRTGWEWVVEEVFQPLDKNTILARGETAELAICRAALEVVAEEALNSGERCT